MLTIPWFKIYETYDKRLLARIDKENEGWFFKVILSSMIRDDRMTVDEQGLNRKMKLTFRSLYYKVNNQGAKTNKRA
jgi:hypothetical protein